MNSGIEVAFGVVAVGTYLTVLGFRENYRANALSIYIASAFVVALIAFQLIPFYIQYWIDGEPVQFQLNLLWGLGSYWGGLKFCDGRLPGFYVDWCSMMRCSLVAFALYYLTAMAFAVNGALFIFMCIPCLVLSCFLPIFPWIEDSGIYILHHWR